MRLVFTLLICALAGITQAELVPFPEAKLIAQGDEPARSREFVLSAVEKDRRETSIERLVNVVATRRWITFEVPISTDMDKLKAHYTDQLVGQVLFQCEGRDCGRSNTWANQIFGQAVLYGRDQEQTYIAAQVDQQLVVVYLIKRGNRRQYAHVEIWQPETMPPHVKASGDISEWQDWWANFARTGFAVIPQVQPQANGELSKLDITLLATWATNMPSALIPQAQDPNLQLVCHLYPSIDAEGPQDLSDLLAASSRCAAVAADSFAAGGVNVTPHGVGPLAPNKARASSRLVLVAPKRLNR